MSFENIFEFFVIAIYPPLLFVLGIIGNILGFLIFSRKKFEKLAIRNLLRYLAVLDSFYLFQIIADYLTYLFNIDIRLISSNWCKVFTYFNYSLCPIASWTLVVISIERTISITSSKFTYLFHKREIQLTLIAIIILYNSIAYTAYPFFFDLIESDSNISNDTNTDYLCDYTQELPSKMLPLMDLFNSSIIPFSLLTATSLYSIHYIFNSRARFSEISTTSSKPININRKEKFKKDLKFSVTVFILNAIFLVYNLPICIANYTDVSDFTYIVTLYLFYANFATNFWIFFMFNSLFREEFLVALHLRKSRQQYARNDS